MMNVAHAGMVTWIAPDKVGLSSEGGAFPVGSGAEIKEEAFRSPSYQTLAMIAYPASVG